MIPSKCLMICSFIWHIVWWPERVFVNTISVSRYVSCCLYHGILRHAMIRCTPNDKILTMITTITMIIMMIMIVIITITTRIILMLITMMIIIKTIPKPTTNLVLLQSQTLCVIFVNLHIWLLKDRNQIIRHCHWPPPRIGVAQHQLTKCQIQALMCSWNTMSRQHFRVRLT